MDSDTDAGAAAARLVENNMIQVDGDDEGFKDGTAIWLTSENPSIIVSAPASAVPTRISRHAKRIRMLSGRSTCDYRASLKLGDESSYKM
jgi:hypothetical protein